MFVSRIHFSFSFIAIFRSRLSFFPSINSISIARFQFNRSIHKIHSIHEMTLNDKAFVNISFFISFNSQIFHFSEPSSNFSFLISHFCKTTLYTCTAGPPVPPLICAGKQLGTVCGSHPARTQLRGLSHRLLKVGSVLPSNPARGKSESRPVHHAMHYSHLINASIWHPRLPAIKSVNTEEPGPGSSDVVYLPILAPPMHSTGMNLSYQAPPSPLFASASTVDHK